MVLWRALFIECVYMDQYGEWYSTDTDGGGVFILILVELASELKIDVFQCFHLWVDCPHQGKDMSRQAEIQLNRALLDLADACFQEARVDLLG